MQVWCKLFFAPIVNKLTPFETNDTPNVNIKMVLLD